MPQQKSMKVQDIRVDEQVRKSCDPKEMAELTASVKAHGILQPVLVMKNGRMLAGHRRLKAAIAAGLECVPVIVADEVLTDSQIKVIQLTENIQRSDLTDPEVYVACQELMALNAGWKLSDLAAHLHKDASMVTRIMSVNELAPLAKEAFMAGKFRFGKAYAISKLPTEQQGAMLEASRDDIEAAGRKKRAPVAADTVKLFRVRYPMSTGTTVVVSGPEMDLEALIEALSSALDAARKASKDRLDVKTAERVWRDKAKAG
jgi:ParB family chromosome partitioning protein